MIHYIGKPRSSNCWIVTLQLYLAGKIKGLRIKWNGFAFPHPIGITRNGNYVHFKRVKGRSKPFAVWLTGRVQVYHGSLLWGAVEE